MKNLSDIRRLNLIKIKNEVFNNSIARLAEAISRGHSVVSRLLYEPEKKGQKNIGEKLARHIEAALSLPIYFLDNPENIGLNISKPDIDKAKIYEVQKILSSIDIAELKSVAEVIQKMIYAKENFGDTLVFEPNEINIDDIDVNLNESPYKKSS